jgi:hypothetical protein
MMHGHQNIKCKVGFIAVKENSIITFTTPNDWIVSHLKSWNLPLCYLQFSYPLVTHIRPISLASIVHTSHRHLYVILNMKIVVKVFQLMNVIKHVETWNDLYIFFLFNPGVKLRRIRRMWDDRSVVDHMFRHNSTIRWLIAHRVITKSLRKPYETFSCLLCWRFPWLHA